MLIPSSLRECVCFVYAKINGEAKPVGTAFFLSVPLTEKLCSIVVVSALHIIANIQEQSDDGKTYLRVNTRDGGFRIVEVGTDAWVKPDQSVEVVDICFCPWPFPWIESEFDIRWFAKEQAATKDVMARHELGVGNEVAFAGLFVNHHGQKRNEPIVRFGTISAIPSEPVSTQRGRIEAYLIESRSVGGLSGSPVFVDVGLFRGADQPARQWRTGGPGMYLLGVMHGHWNAPKETAELYAKDAAESIDGVLQSISKEYINMGIAVVTPIDKLFKVIDESEWHRLLSEAKKHLTGQEDQTTIVVTDAKTGALIAKTDANAIMRTQPPESLT
jgi:hypothetical protein